MKFIYIFLALILISACKEEASVAPVEQPITQLPDVSYQRACEFMISHKDSVHDARTCGLPGLVICDSIMGSDPADIRNDNRSFNGYYCFTPGKTSVCFDGRDTLEEWPHRDYGNRYVPLPVGWID